MTVKELLVQLRPTLVTHSWATLWSDGTPTKLRIDVEHNHTFHAVGEFSRSLEPFRDSDHYILEPFQYSYYHGYQYGEPHEFKVLDFEVYRWKLEQDEVNDKLWNLEIETRQT